MGYKLYALLVLLVLSLATAAGCGGSDRETPNQDSDSGSQATGGQDSQQAGEDNQMRMPENAETVGGFVLRVTPDSRRLVLRPEEGESRVFLFREPDSYSITLDGEEIGLDEVEAWQNAEVAYITNDNDRAIVRAMEVQASSSRRQVASGRIVRVDLDTNRFVLRVEGVSVRFAFNPEALEVTTNGQEANVDAIQEGLQAEIGYVVNDNDRNVVRSVQLQNFEATVPG